MRKITKSSRRVGPLPEHKTTRKNLSSTPSNTSKKNYFLKRLGLNEQDIHWPKKANTDSTKADYWYSNPHSIQNMYGVSDLSKLDVFQGGYINFGYWEDLNDIRFNNSRRAQASERMYQEIAELAGLDNESRIVDVGCGTAFGCRYIMKRYYPKILIGLDIAPEQILRAKRYHRDILSLFPPNHFRFVVGDATKMPFPDHSLSHVISVEAAQHFPSLKKFIQESERVLKPSGTLIFTTFFATSPEGQAAIKALIPDHITHCSDLTVDDVTSMLTQKLRKAEVKSIGKHVWPSLEKWLRETGYQNQWTILWPALYKAGFIDYFIFRAEAADCNEHNLRKGEELPLRLNQ